MDAEHLSRILDALALHVTNHEYEYWFNFKQGKSFDVLKSVGEGFDAQEIFCEFLGKLQPER